MAARISIFFLFLMGACSKHSAHKDAMLFYGECNVEVVSKTGGAHILIDGINMGHHHAKVDIPCGQKQITVEKEGYVPYREYFAVSVKEPIKVTVELEKLKATPHYALSGKLIEQISKGQRLRDPWSGEKVAANEAPEIEAPTASTKAGTSGTASSAPAGAGAASTAGQDTVDYWR